MHQDVSSISRVYREYIQRVGVTTGPRLTRLHMLRTLTPRLLPFLDVYLLYQVRQVPVSTGRLFFLSLTINCFECSTQSLLWDKTVTANWHNPTYIFFGCILVLIHTPGRVPQGSCPGVCLRRGKELNPYLALSCWVYNGLRWTYHVYVSFRAAFSHSERIRQNPSLSPLWGEPWGVAAARVQRAGRRKGARKGDGNRWNSGFRNRKKGISRNI